jgi:transposase
MDILVERCAALDVHKDIVVACVRLPNPDGGRLQELRAFKATMPWPLGEEH